jgi:hypothetical protein
MHEAIAGRHYKLEIQLNVLHGCPLQRNTGKIAGRTRPTYAKVCFTINMLSNCKSVHRKSCWINS